MTTPGGAVSSHDTRPSGGVLPDVPPDRRRSGGRRRSGWVVTLVGAAVLGVALGRFVMAGSTSTPPVPAAARTTDRSTQGQVDSLQARLRATPDDAGLLADLGVAYLSRAKETADPTWYTKAGEALDRGSALDANNIRILTAQGLLALSRHDFATALELGTRAHALAPSSADPFGIVVDAHVELGQYPEAAAAAQEMVDRRPSLASLARISYVRELTGDHAGATTAMAQAVVAGSGSADDVAYVQALLGDLRLGAGDLDAADAAYVRATDTEAGYAAAEVGRAKVAAARGDLAGAATRLEPVVNRLPNPAWVALLGDIDTALGRNGDASAQYGLVRQIEQLNQANGVAVDFELAHFEADHAADPGADPAATVSTARAALGRRPTVFAEDTMGWALRQAGRPAEALDHARAAVRLGTGDALLWWHLARTEADLGMGDDARRDLGTAFSVNRYLSVRDLPPARALAAELGMPS
jgi:tetratricopeptide (TPR) repeat protein